MPSFFYSEPVGERYRLGLAVNVPMGIGTDYGDTWSGRYMGQSSSLVFASFSPVAAYRVNDWLSIGGGLSIIYNETESEVAVNNLQPGRPDGEMELEMSGYGFGALAELSPRTRQPALRAGGEREDRPAEHADQRAAERNGLCARSPVILRRDFGTRRP